MIVNLTKLLLFPWKTQEDILECSPSSPLNPAQSLRFQLVNCGVIGSSPQIQIPQVCHLFGPPTALVT